jgi:uncharacterized membrane protein YhaH (DUF805 family)
MEMVTLIENYVYLLLKVFLMVFCLATIRNRGGRLLGIAFAVLVVSQLTWHVASILDLHNHFKKVYEWLNHINTLLYVVYIILFVYAISYIARNPSVREDKVAISSRQLLFSLKGRISRKIFWGMGSVLGLIGWVYYVMVMLLLENMKNMIDGKLWQYNLLLIILSVVYLFFGVWMGLAVQVKRWHDRGNSGWMIFIVLIPVIGFILALIELGFNKGDSGPNKYGDDPLQPAGNMQVAGIPPGVETGGEDSVHP